MTAYLIIAAAICFLLGSIFGLSIENRKPKCTRNGQIPPKRNPGYPPQPINTSFKELFFADYPDEEFPNIDFRRGALWAQEKLKERNT